METIKNSYPIFREAKVINTSDPEELGRIQLKVYPELIEIPDSDCPWCFPNDGGIHGKSFGLPPVGKTICCIVWSRFWTEITFLPFSLTKPTEHLYDNWMKNQHPKISDMKSDPEEEHFVVDQFEDDFCIFHDTKNNQHGFLHPSGTYIIISKDGSINNEFAKDYKIKTSGNFSIETTGDTKIESKGKVDIKSSGPCKVESSGMTTVKGSSKVIVDASILEFTGNKSMGKVNPSGSGICGAISVCPVIKMPHIG